MPKPERKWKSLEMQREEAESGRRSDNLADKCMSDSCDRPLLPGQRIVQMAKGRCFSEQITPTYTDLVIGEWHVECFREFELQPQVRPYKCLKCNQQILHGQEVFYTTIGRKPASGYIRPENRGDELQSVTHSQKCPKKLPMQEHDKQWREDRKGHV